MVNRGGGGARTIEPLGYRRSQQLTTKSMKPRVVTTAELEETKVAPATEAPPR
jgi:hypothetical protein